MLMTTCTANEIGGVYCTFMCKYSKIYISAESIKSALTRQIAEILDFEPAFCVTGTRQWKISFRDSSRNVPGTDFGDLVSNHVPTASKNMFWHQLTKFVPRNVLQLPRNVYFTGACQFLQNGCISTNFSNFLMKIGFLERAWCVQ